MDVYCQALSGNVLEMSNKSTGKLMCGAGQVAICAIKPVLSCATKPVLICLSVSKLHLHLLHV